MPKEKPEEETLATKVTSLQRAGVPLIATVVVLVLSSPGFYEFFLNKTDDEAKVKAEVAYQLLKVQAEGLEKKIDRQADQIEQLRGTVNAMLLQRSSMGMSAMHGPEPEPAPPAPAAVELQPLPANLDALTQQRME